MKYITVWWVCVPVRFYRYFRSALLDYKHKNKDAQLKLPFGRQRNRMFFIKNTKRNRKKLRMYE